MIIKRVRGGDTYDFDTDTKTFYNPRTDKWVKKPVKSKKGEAVGKAIGKSRKRCKNSKNNYIIFETLEDVCYEYSKGDPYKAEKFWIYVTALYDTHIHYSTIYKSSSRDIYSYISTRESLQLIGESHIEIRNTLEISGMITIVDEYINSYKYINMIYLSDDITTSARTPQVVMFAKNDDKHQLILAYELKEMTDRNETQRRIFDSIIMNLKWDNSFLDDDRIKETTLNRMYKRYLDKWESTPRVIDDEPSTKEEWRYDQRLILKRLYFWNDYSTLRKLRSYSQDKFGNRLHSIASNTSTYLLEYFNIGGEYFDYELDLQTSQPIILTQLLKNIDGYDVSKCKFTNDVGEYDIYERIQKQLKLKSRSLSKKFVMGMLFGRIPERYENAFSIFCEKYKYTGEALTGIKTEQRPTSITGTKHPLPPYKNLAMDLQRLESLIFNEIWKKLLDYGIKFLPIHDGICCFAKDKDEIREIMERIIKRHIDIEFNIVGKSLILPLKEREVIKNG